MSITDSHTTRFNEKYCFVPVQACTQFIVAQDVRDKHEFALSFIL